MENTTKSSASSARPAPRVNQENAPYWKAAHDGKLMLAECTACGKIHHPPQFVGPFCWSTKVKPTFAGGRGTVNSFSVIHQTAAPGFRERVPYVLAYVDLEEGVSLVSNVVNCDVNKVSIGMAVKAVFEPLSGDTGAVLFEPA